MAVKRGNKNIIGNKNIFGISVLIVFALGFFSVSFINNEASLTGYSVDESANENANAYVIYTGSCRDSCGAKTSVQEGNCWCDGGSIVKGDYCTDITLYCPEVLW